MTYKKTTFAGCLLFLLSFSITLQGQLRANFGATPLSGCAPLLVQFSDSSTGNPTFWQWDLGNATTSFLQNPSALYFDPGVYSVKLVIKNGANQDSVIKTQFIRVFAAPTVQFTANKLTGCFPLKVNFTNLSIAGSGSIAHWQWDFGDGFSSTQPNPVHVYTAAGNYNVTLQIVNTNGCISTITKSQYIKINSGVNAAFDFPLPNTCSAPVTINFNNLSTGTGTLSYQWNFGDGNSSNIISPTHTYNNPGSYSVSLIAVNTNGCRDTFSMNNAISVGNVNANFSAPLQVCEGSNVTFTNTSIPNPVAANWSFGDGTFSNALSPIKTYTSTGTFTVKLVANFGACIDSAIKNIIVNPVPAAAFSADDSTSCIIPFTVNFTNQTTNGVTYLWDFGDGITDNTNTPTHTFNDTGTYSLQLIATNNFGCSDTLIKPNYILLQKPEVLLANLPDSGCIPLTKNFISVVNTVDPVTDYLWDFGDGNTATGASPTNTFSNPGAYTVSVIITTASGCKDTATMPRAITVNVKPHAAFGAEPRIQCAKLPIQFLDSSTGGVTGWYWSFGDGVSSTAQNPLHQYIDTGFFPVMLVAYNGGCPDTLVIDSFVFINPPIAKFKVTYVCNRPFERIFTDQSIGADEWHWYFGDGDSSAVQNPTHSYAATGVYDVTLTVKNSSTGCEFTVTKQVRVIVITNNFTASDTMICKGNSVTFTSGLSMFDVDVFQWDFGDGFISIDSNNYISHRYEQSGTYTVQLIVTDKLGCNDTLVKPMYIRVNGPTAGFAPAVVGSCSNALVTFNDNSLTDGINPITTWEWNYGDGITEILSAPPFQHQYLISGSYIIHLKVTDIQGCTDSFTLPSALIISNPKALFWASDSLTCPNHSISFINLSTGGTLQYKWDFGDGTTSTLATPSHAYAADGTYTVSLRITNEYGCIDSLAKINYINVITPVAAFSLSDSVSTCPPLSVQFTNFSNPAYNSLWDFGDGTFSTAVNPSHFYSTSGTYIVKLTISGPVSCTDTRQKTIVVNGPKGIFSYTPLSGCKPHTVNFTSSTVNTASFIWDFNDGTTLSTTDSAVSHTYTYPGRYVPKMILLDLNGCVVPISGKDTIEVKGVTTRFTFNHVTLCDSGTVFFRDSSYGNDNIISHIWYFGDGDTSSAVNPSHHYQFTGIYFPKLVLQTQSGCLDSLSALVPVKIVYTPRIAIVSAPNGCTPLNAIFGGQITRPDTSSLTWNWTFGNGNTSNLQNPPQQTYSLPATYQIQLIATNSSGCSATATQTIQAYQVPVINAGIDTLICKGRGINLNATGADSLYIWSPPTGLSCTICQSPISTPDTLTYYAVTGITKHGCRSNDSVLVRVKYPFKINYSPSDTLCFGESVILNASGAYTYNWSPSTWLNHTNISSPVSTPQGTITYMVVGTDDRNCFHDTGYVPLKVYPIPVVEAGPDRVTHAGFSMNIIPSISSDITQIAWSPTTAIASYIYPGISVKPSEDIEYTIDVKNEGGCTASDKVKISVLCDGANIYFPNTFTPNGDGMNDIFYPRGSGLFHIRSLRIFSRWGEVMFERSNFNANDPALGWDGTFKNAKLNNDVYVYTAEILCKNGTLLMKKGNVAIVK